MLKQMHRFVLLDQKISYQNDTNRQSVEAVALNMTEGKGIGKGHTDC